MAEVVNLIDRVIAQVPQSDNETVQKAERKALARYLPVITKENYKDFRRSLTEKLGGKVIDDMGALPAIAEAHASAIAKLEATHAKVERRAVQGARAFGALLGLAGGAILAAAIILMMQDVIWATATDSFREQAMTGALLRGSESAGE